MMKLALSLCFALSFTLTLAQDLEIFKTRYAYKRGENGQVVQIIDQNISLNKSILKFSERLKETLESTGQALDGSMEKDLQSLNIKNLEKVLNEKRSKDYVVVNLVNTKDRKGYKLKTVAKYVKLVFAKAFTVIPYGGSAISFLAGKFLFVWDEAHLYNQNLLYYYLENFEASELGLTEREVRLAKSDVAKGWRYWGHRKSKKNWEFFWRTNS